MEETIGYVIEVDDFTKLRAIANILYTGDYIDSVGRCDLGHKLLTIIDNAHEVTKDDTNMSM